MTRARRLLVAATLLLLAVPAGRAAADDAFRVTYTVDRSQASATVVSGRVINEGRVDALDVYVTAQALDAAGRVVASGVTFVSPLIPSRGTATYTARVPTMPGVVAYRVSVSSFRAGFGPQAG